uniref:Inorganic phosphate transporter 1-11-like n=1 Tax=Rhizophora mucronata TaxID=61149 RepID=A0A2P2LZ65_RHIMU
MAFSNNLCLLNSMDNAPTQKYHFILLAITGMGFLSTAYNIFCINPVSKLLGRLYYYNPATKSPGQLPVHINNIVTGVALSGTLGGQLFFGWLGDKDKIGRKRSFQITLILTFVCAICSGLGSGASGSTIGVLCFFRFWLGFGVGGTYPLCATIMAEYANRKTRGAFIGAVFAMQGVGIILAGLVPMVLSKIFLSHFEAKHFNQEPNLSTRPQGKYLWRLVLMIGALPAALTYFLLRKMPETARYRAVVEGNLTAAVSDMRRVLRNVESRQETKKLAKFRAVNSYGLLSIEFFERHGIHLFGTMSTWYLLDMAFYSQNLTQKDLFSAIGFTKKPDHVNALEEVYEQSRAMFLVAFFGTFPGYLCTVFLVEKLGRFVIQIIGFLLMSTFMLIMGVKYDDFKAHKPVLFALLYGLTFFFANFGPNATTFIIPAELFPTRLRATCHGLSAAAGKLGAVVGTFVVQTSTSNYEDDTGDRTEHPGDRTKHSLMVLAFTNMLGFCCTFLVTETKELSLEEISGEDGGQNEVDLTACPLIVPE